MYTRVGKISVRPQWNANIWHICKTDAENMYFDIILQVFRSQNCLTTAIDVMRLNVPS